MTSRRTLLRGAAATLVAASSAGRLLAEPMRGFTHGIASGEPTASSILLWTRYVGAGATPLRAEIAADPDFRRIAATSLAMADADTDWTARTILQGLEPGRRWWYRFVAPDGSRSEIGRTATLPDGLPIRYTLAVFSCANLPFGWFNAYGHAAQDPDIDLAVHLGDYIYEYPRGIYPSAAEALPGRVIDPAGAAVHLADYRARYASYRRDPDLRALHARVPWIAIWDDHEFADNAYRDGAYNHHPATEGEWTDRKAAAARAWREWLPVSGDDRWTVRDVGALASLIVLETRITGRMAPVDFYPLFDKPGFSPADLQRFRDVTWRSPEQRMLGAEQETWLHRQLHETPRRTRYQVLVQSVPMGMCLLPDAALGWQPAGGPAGRRDVEQLVAAAHAGIPFNMDNWNGFPAQRDRILTSAQSGGGKLIVLSGDSHNAWAYRLRANGRSAAMELSVPSVTSPGFDAWFPHDDPEVVARAMVARNDELLWADTSRRGYGRLVLAHDHAQLVWLASDPIRRRSSTGRQIHVEQI